jgi:hypothetical protein
MISGDVLKYRNGFCVKKPYETRLAASSQIPLKRPLGEMITFTGPELADIIAFDHHDATQHGFSERNLTPAARKMMQHELGGMTAPKSHGEEIGHATPSNTPLNCPAYCLRRDPNRHRP